MLSKIRFKKGVVVDQCLSNGTELICVSVSSDITFAMQKVNRISIAIAQKKVVITSCLEGKHMPNSFHYSGNAFDFRSRIYTVSILNRICDALRSQLGTDYDVIIEKDYVHVEFDPK